VRYENAILGGLLRQERAEDAYALETEGCEQRTIDALMDALEQHDPSIEMRFIEWIAEEGEAFAWAMLHPGERTHKEIIDNWRAKWVREIIDDQGWQELDRFYKLGVR